MNLALRKIRDHGVLAVSTAFLAACASVGSGPSTTAAPAKGTAVAAPSLGLFSKIKAPSDREPVLQLHAQGVQIFRCEKRDGGFAWNFRQPEAELTDANGKAVGRHGANFSFESVDGSRLVGTIVSNEEAPQSGNLRWLLMTTKSYNKGAFEDITHVQRVNTKGGMPPARCESAQLGQVLRVDFSADFVFYRLRADA